MLFESILKIDCLYIGNNEFLNTIVTKLVF